MSGFQLKSGAIACSIGHDNHNIIVLGTNFEDMSLAVNRLNEIQGGQIVVNSGKILSEISYPVCGLLSDLPAEKPAIEKEKANRTIICNCSEPDNVYKSGSEQLNQSLSKQSFSKK